MKAFTATFAAALLSLSGASLAQSWPAKPVRYIVSFPPGGPPDIGARLLSERLTRAWGQTVIVDNRSGAGGTVGGAAGAKAAPDGYTLLQCNIATNAIAYSLYAKLPYEPRDLVAITRISTTAIGIVVHPSLPAANVREFIAYAKANPGRLSYGATAAGSSPQLMMELFKLTAKVDIVHIAYKGAAPAIADALGGQIPVAVSTLPPLIAPVQAGRLRALVVTGAKRASAWPSVPTAIESGLPGFEVTSWYGVCAPTGTPKPILDKVHADVTAALSAPELQHKLVEQMMEPAPMSPADFDAFIQAETGKWAKVVKEAAIPRQQGATPF
jgi:tripartite-type tricarboxylate transporter receptor subunit TctC